MNQATIKNIEEEWGKGLKSMHTHTVSVSVKAATIHLYLTMAGIYLSLLLL